MINAQVISSDIAVADINSHLISFADSRLLAQTSGIRRFSVHYRTTRYLLWRTAVTVVILLDASRCCQKPTGGML